MSDLTKLADDLSSLTVLEADELAAILSTKRDADAGHAGDVLRKMAETRRGSRARDENLRDLLAEDWLTAESLSLRSEAVALARSLDETLDYVRLRCEAVRKAA